MGETFGNKVTGFMDHAREVKMISPQGEIKKLDGSVLIIEEPSDENRGSYFFNLDFGTRVMKDKATKNKFPEWNVGRVLADLKVNDKGDVIGLNSLDMEIQDAREYQGMAFTVYKNGLGYQLWYKYSTDKPHMVEFDRIRGEYGAKMEGDNSKLISQINAPDEFDIAEYMLNAIDVNADLDQLRKSLFNKEMKLKDDEIVSIQISTDESSGADVFGFRGNRVALVDGIGSGKDSFRGEALELMNKLLNNDGDNHIGAYIGLTFNEDKTIDIKARGGGYMMFFNEVEKGKLTPEGIYIGKDDKDSPIISNKINATNCKYVLLLTDGGLSLLGDEDLFGGIDDKRLKDIKSTTESFKYLQEDDAKDNIKDHLLKVFSKILELGGDFSTIPKSFIERVAKFNKKTINKDEIKDDQTLLLLSADAFFKRVKSD